MDKIRPSELYKSHASVAGSTVLKSLASPLSYCRGPGAQVALTLRLADITAVAPAPLLSFASGRVIALDDDTLIQQDPVWPLLMPENCASLMLNEGKDWTPSPETWTCPHPP